MPRIQNPQMREILRNMVCVPVDFIPPAADNDWFKTSTTLSAQTTTLLAASMTKSYCPGWPVVPVVVITNDKSSGETSWTSVSCTFVGVDQFNETQSSVVSAVNANDTWTATSNLAFMTLTSVEFTVTGGTECDSSDSYVIGFNKTYGLGQKIAASTDVRYHNFNGATDAGTISTTYHTYTIAGTPNGTAHMQWLCRTSLYD